MTPATRGATRLPPLALLPPKAHSRNWTQYTPVSSVAEHEPAPSFWQKEACAEIAVPIAPLSITCSMREARGRAEA